MSIEQTPEAKAKQYDLEETPREKARRLTSGDVQRLTQRYSRLRERLYHHGRYLTDEDKRELVKFLEGEFEQTRTILDGVGGVREFGFSSDLLDDID